MYNQHKFRVVESMSVDKINVRRKENKKPPRNFLQIIVGLICVVLFCIIGLIWFLIFTDRLSFASTELEVIQNGAGKIIRVPKGGNLQSAINIASGGDVIELQAGATYSEITLPKKTFTDFVTIKSSASEQLSEDVRVSPSKANLMAKIVSRAGKSAVAVENGANRFRFVGIEFMPSGKDYVYNLIYLGTESDLAADVPHDFEFDRCYFRSIKENVTRRAIAINSRNTTIENSYFEGFAFSGEETQAILGWTGTKNAKIINNYIEGGAENIMFGGGDPPNAEMIPQDIIIRGNHFNKPAEWKGKAALKCLFELKNAKRVEFTENYLENNWVGSALRITLRSEDGKSPFNTIEDVVVKNNVINGAGEGINILGKDDYYSGKPNSSEGQTMKRLTITNNLFLNIGGEQFEGSGYFVQVSDGEQITISNNTSFNIGNIASFHGTLPRNFVFRDNIVAHGEYGIHGLENVKSPAAQKFFQNNVFVNNKNLDVAYTSFPPNNILARSFQDIGFAGQNDFRLSAGSKFKGKASGGKDVGSNLMFDPNGKSIRFASEQK